MCADRSPATRIAAAACRPDAGPVYHLPPPARHHDVIRAAGIMFRPDQQGFITDCGRWVDRQEALRIARAAGQLIGEPSAPSHGLYSEDVW